uniref:Uncharacterized protein n=1 Tax=Podoviridae sp. ct8Lf7 TaxID=2827723 RepID=A0A8S5S135_9CAUD|nr:MAG TPA: hypothetical protein [Podoviridae sp. ct8Lf7]
MNHCLNLPNTIRHYIYYLYCLIILLTITSLFRILLKIMKI